VPSRSTAPNKPNLHPPGRVGGVYPTLQSGAIAPNKPNLGYPAARSRVAVTNKANLPGGAVVRCTNKPNLGCPARKGRVAVNKQTQLVGAKCEKRTQFLDCGPRSQPGVTTLRMVQNKPNLRRFTTEAQRSQRRFWTPSETCPRFHSRWPPCFRGEYSCDNASLPGVVPATKPISLRGRGLGDEACCTNKPNLATWREHHTLPIRPGPGSARGRTLPVGPNHGRDAHATVCRSGDRRSREGKLCETNPISGSLKFEV
jgi:hypothetical protein